MKICIISDTHGMHDQIIVPSCDILIHCGDISFFGKPCEVDSFIKWFKQQPAINKVYVLGNHEVELAKLSYSERLEILSEGGIHYLENTSVTLEGLKFWGSPYTPKYGDWAFMLRAAALRNCWDQVPDNINILITHGPPYKILDFTEDGEHKDEGEHAGCEHLLKKVYQLPLLKLHCFGHLHSGFGVLQQGNITFVNAASCNNRYEPVNQPIIIEL